MLVRDRESRKAAVGTTELKAFASTTKQQRHELHWNFCQYAAVAFFYYYCKLMSIYICTASIWLNYHISSQASGLFYFWVLLLVLRIRDPFFKASCFGPQCSELSPVHDSLCFFTCFRLAIPGVFNACLSKAEKLAYR